MKKKLIISLILGFVATVTFIIACKKETDVTPSNYNPANNARKAKPRASALTSAIIKYYSPDSSVAYFCYAPCTVTPAPTGIAYSTYVNNIIQVGLENLGYVGGMSNNYADSIQYIFDDGTNAVCWTEKWCNTNGSFTAVSSTGNTTGKSSLQELFNASSGNSVVTVTCIAYGNNGTPSSSFTTSPIRITY